MAKYQFADKAREALEKSGVGFNPDGTTFKKVENKTTVFAGEQGAERVNEEPKGKVEQPQQSEPKQEQKPEDNESAKIITMQREEIERLREQVGKFNNVQSSKDDNSRELEELRKELEEAKRKLDEVNSKKEQDELAKILAKDTFGFETVDDEVAKELRDNLVAPIYKGLHNQIADLQNQLKTVTERTRPLTDEEKREQLKRSVNEKIFKEIPDFDVILNSKDFKKKLAARDDRYPHSTYGEVMQYAYEQGNHEFIIREVKNFLNGGKAQADVNAVADVSATNGGSNAKQSKDAGNKSGFTFTDEEAIEMLRKRQRGDITRQEYSEYRAKLGEYRSR